MTVPTRMTTEDAWVLGGVLGVGGLLYVWDEGLLNALQRQDGHAIHDGMREVGDFFEPLGLMGNTNAWYGVGILTGYLSGWDPLLQASRDLLVSHWLSAATYNPPRTWIGRARPEGGRGPRAFGGGTGLPSGHASTIVQVAAVLSHHIGWTPASVALWGAAGAVLVQRVDSGKHWPADVWIGAAWGYGVARLVLRRADERRATDTDGTTGGDTTGAAIRITPYVDARSGQPGVAVSVPLR